MAGLCGCPGPVLLRSVQDALLVDVINNISDLLMVTLVPVNLLNLGQFGFEISTRVSDLWLTNPEQRPTGYFESCFSFHQQTLGTFFFFFCFVADRSNSR